MSVNYRVLVFLFLVSSLTIRTAEADSVNADKNVTNLHCNGSGECSAELADPQSPVAKACQSPKQSVSWNAKFKNAFLIICDCDCTTHDNEGWLIENSRSESKATVRQVYLGKETTIASMRKNPSRISDIMASHPLCEALVAKMLDESSFVTLVKRPTHGRLESYCFSPVYIARGEKGLQFKGPDSNFREDGFRGEEVNNFKLRGAILKMVNDMETDLSVHANEQIR